MADAIWGVHTAVVTFFAFGWALPWRLALWGVVLGAIALRMHWWLNRGVCVLTQLEHRLRGGAAVDGSPTSPSPRSRDARPAQDAPPPQDSTFIGNLAQAVLGRPLSAHLVDRATHGILWLAAGIAGLRLLAT